MKLRDAKKADNDSQRLWYHLNPELQYFNLQLNYHQMCLILSPETMSLWFQWLLEQVHTFHHMWVLQVDTT